MRELLDLPLEVQHNILCFLKAREITRFGRTCSKAYVSISPDHSLIWQSAFLLDFDNPLHRLSLLPGGHQSLDSKWNWYAQLKKRLSAFRSISGALISTSLLDHDEIAETFLEILDQAHGSPLAVSRTDGSGDISTQDYKHSRNMAWFNHKNNPDFMVHFIDTYKSSQNSAAASWNGNSTFNPASRHFTRSIARLERPYRSNAISRLHVLFGLTDYELRFEQGKGAARRLVYDMSCFGPSSDYGPYNLDGSGRINWQMLEAISIVIGRNIQRLTENLITIPQGLGYSLPYLTKVDPCVPHDWAGITGAWLGTYCFLDYQDLFHYNIGHAGSLEDEIEACGDLMRLDLKLDETEQARKDWRMKTILPECSDPPPLFFSGTSRGHGGPSQPVIGVRGRVSLFPSGKEVRWRFIISYGGADQWQLEGVQPGGIRSGAIFCSWSHSDHEIHGPVGPCVYYPLPLCEAAADA